MANQTFSVFDEDPSSEKPSALRSPFDVSIFQTDKASRRSHPVVARFLSGTLPAARLVVQTALQRYGTKKLAVAFNGGKDCTCLLQIVLEELKSSEKSLDTPAGLPVVYFRSRPQFVELEDFMRDKVQTLELNYLVYEGPLKESLVKFRLDHPEVEGIFMGTRCKDPSSKDLSAFSPTDPDWPKFMRILPVLHFSYHDVWLCLKEFDVYYCRLYDEGYTSIGWEGNTLRNPKLRVVGGDGVVSYQPAYMLEDSDDERTSRE